MSEVERRNQARALVDSLEPDIPTIVQGDFNTLRADMSGASLATKLGNFGIRIAARVLPDSPLGISIKGMNERSVMPYLEEQGFGDGDPRKRPTAPAILPAFGIDYVLHDRATRIDQVKVRSNPAASDHASISYRARF